MKQFGQRGVGLLVLLALVMNLVLPAAAAGTKQISQAVQTSADYMLSAVPGPAVSAIGGEWAVIGLARSGCTVPKGYYEDYYDRVVDYTVRHKGVLHTKKYTEYSRVILALAALGQDARNVGGYDLTAPLGDFDKTVYQGINGAIWALIALDSRDYPMPTGTATRQKYVDYILSKQHADGGWGLTGTTADPDVTAMALQALSGYRKQNKVATAVKQGLNCLSGLQNADGSFSTYGTATAESCAQVLTALCQLGITPEDKRFIKKNNTVVDALLNYCLTNGSFCHTKGGQSDLMATEQGFYALVALQRMSAGQSALYAMTDAPSLLKTQSTGALSGKHPDVRVHSVVNPGITFSDVVGHPNRDAIQTLARYGIVSGKGGGKFAPKDSLARAEFAAMAINSLGLSQKQTKAFSDVKSNHWFAGYVGGVCHYGIASGKGNGRFDPNGTITRQEAAVMVARAAALCGMDTEMTGAQIRRALVGFSDYVTAADWAQGSLAFCYSNDVLDGAALDVRPTQAISRGEAAQMFCVLLEKAGLLQ